MKTSLSLKCKGLLLCLFWLIGIEHTYSQDFNNYTIFRPEGKLPLSFLKSSIQKANEEFNKVLEANAKQNYKHKKKEFLQANNFLIDEMLLSGKVLFNDPISAYVNKIADSILKDDPKLRSQLEIYIVKSYALNAFTTSRGSIFINMGLIARMRNEAELAYILCHEIIHYKNKHVLSEFEQAENLKHESGLYRNPSISEQELEKSMYSRELESEADVQGLKIYLRSNYKLSELKNVFDILQFSHIPFANQTFNKSLFETSTFKLPGSYQLKETRPLQAQDNADSLSSHPKVKLRRDSILHLIRGMKDNNRMEFIVSKEEFMKVREMARFEITQTYLENRKYEAAIYNCFLLSKDHPNNKFLETCILKALYGLNKYASECPFKFKQVLEDYEDIQGKQQGLYFLIQNLDAKELAILAANYSWRIFKKYPNDREIKALAIENMRIMVDYSVSTRSYFSAIPDHNTNADTIPTSISFKKTNNLALASPGINLLKFKKHKIIPKSIALDFDEATLKPLPRYCKFAFVDDVNDNYFKYIFDSLADGKTKYLNDQKTEKLTTDFYATDDWTVGYENTHKIPKPLGMNKVVFVNPFYYKVDVRKDIFIRSQASEEAEANFNTTIRAMALACGLTYDIIDKKQFEANEVSYYNDMAILNDWMEEFYLHGTQINFLNYKNEAFEKIKERYQTKYFCWTGFMTVRTQNIGFLKLVASCFFPPLIPLAVYKTLEPNYTTVQYTMVLNIETGTLEYLSTKEYSIKDRNDVIKSSLFEVFTQIKTPAH